MKRGAEDAQALEGYLKALRIHRKPIMAVTGWSEAETSRIMTGAKELKFLEVLELGRAIERVQTQVAPQ